MNAFLASSTSSPRERTTGGLTLLEQRRITSWISDAFAILCVRVSGPSHAEKQLRLGFERILRQLGTSPLRAITKSPLPAYAAPAVTSFDLRFILQALDASLALSGRYGNALNQNQRRAEELMRATRAFASEELGVRTARRREHSALDCTPAAVMLPVDSPADVVLA